MHMQKGGIVLLSKSTLQYMLKTSKTRINIGLPPIHYAYYRVKPSHSLASMFGGIYTLHSAWLTRIFVSHCSNSYMALLPSIMRVSKLETIKF